MRKVILAAALAATFCLSQTSHAQQGGGGTGAGAPAGGAVGGANTPQGQGAAGGPPTTGSFSVQNQNQGAFGAGNQTGPGGAGQAGVAQPGGGVAGGGGQTFMGTGDQAPGAATGAGQTFFGPGEPSATGTGGAGTGTSGAAGTGADRTGAGRDIATSSPRADEPTDVGPASEDPQVQLAHLRAEVDRLRAELAEARGERRGNEVEGTGGSGSQQEAEPQPIASAVLEGRVSKVSQKSIEVIDDETGEPYVLRLTEDSRARRGQRRIPVTRIREGSEVRASFELISGDTYATQIDVKGKGRR